MVRGWFLLFFVLRVFAVFGRAAAVIQSLFQVGRFVPCFCRDGVAFPRRLINFDVVISWYGIGIVDGPTVGKARRSDVANGLFKCGVAN